MARTMQLDPKNFCNEVLGSDTPVLVDFWAPRCGPSQLFEPIVDELATEYAGRAKVTKVNVEDHPRLARQFSVRGVPAVMVFKDGMLASSLRGLPTKNDVAHALEAACA